jgi:hypothetical protein
VADNLTIVVYLADDTNVNKMGRRDTTLTLHHKKSGSRDRLSIIHEYEHTFIYSMNTLITWLHGLTYVNVDQFLPPLVSFYFIKKDHWLKGEKSMHG